MAKDLVPLKTVPFRFGAFYDKEPASLELGQLSRCRNVRPKHTGGIQRKGQIEQHTANTNHSTKNVMKTYGFSKGKRVEKYLFALFSDGKVDKASNIPPTITTGEFGTNILAAPSDLSKLRPASFSNYKDLCFYSDAARQHQVFTGNETELIGFFVIKGTETIKRIPEEGSDYSIEVSDGRGTTFADLGSLDRLATDFHAVYFISLVPINQLNLELSAYNSTDVDLLSIGYWSGNGFTAASGISDGTDSGGVTLAQDGSISWTSPSDEVPGYAFGIPGFVYRLYHSHATNTLDATVKVTKATVEYTGGFQPIHNVWDGVRINPSIIEVEVATEQERYAYNAFRCGELAVGKYITIYSPVNLFGIYLDVYRTPNTEGSTAIIAFEVWTGSGFTALSNVEDGTGGGKEAGHITWDRDSNATIKSTKASKGYVFRVKFDSILSADLTWLIQGLPFFDIDDIYPEGQFSIPWKDRMCYTFNTHEIHLTPESLPLTLNGIEWKIVKAGDGRFNRVLCMRGFYGEMIAWQEERGDKGGCTTLIEERDGNYGKILLSDEFGIMNSKCAVVLDDVDTSALTPQRPLFKGAFWLSVSGFKMTDGTSVTDVSEGISHHFDPTHIDAIRKGYEKEHTVEWCKAYNGIRLGLVTGSSATTPNTFYFFDPYTGKFGDDTLEQDLSCMANIEADSGNISILQVGGTSDGKIMQLNTTDNDIAAAIDYDILMELNGGGKPIILQEESIFMKAMAAGNLTRTVSRDGNTTLGDSVTIPMQAKVANDVHREYSFNNEFTGDHITIRHRNNVVSETPFIISQAVELKQGELSDE